MIILNRKESFDSLLVRLRGIFNNRNILGDLQKRCADSIEVKFNHFNEEFQRSTFSLIALAAIKETGICSSSLKELERIKYYNYTQISTYLSFTSKDEAQANLLSTPYINNDYIFNLLEYSFYSLVLTDSQVQRRFKVAYTLWQHTVEIGISGFSTKLNRLIPYYLTYFGNRVFLINPIEGWVKSFRRVKDLRSEVVGLGIETLEDKKVCVAFMKNNKYVVLVEETSYGLSIDVKLPVKLAQSDRKVSERRRLREKGFEVEETPWMTTYLDEVDGSSFNIRTHSLICLMTYGLDVMKYGIMEANSIFTVDHVDGQHANNVIDNLELLTRKSNNDKKNNKYDWYMNYFSYWEKQIASAKKVQENFDFRSKN